MSNLKNVIKNKIQKNYLIIIIKILILVVPFFTEINYSYKGFFFFILLFILFPIKETFFSQIYDKFIIFTDTYFSRTKLILLIFTLCALFIISQNHYLEKMSYYANNDSEVDYLETRINNIQNEVSNLDLEVESMKSDINDIESEVTSLKLNSY